MPSLASWNHSGAGSWRVERLPGRLVLSRGGHRGIKHRKTDGDATCGESACTHRKTPRKRERIASLSPSQAHRKHPVAAVFAPATVWYRKEPALRTDWMFLLCACATMRTVCFSDKTVGRLAVAVAAVALTRGDTVRPPRMHNAPRSSSRAACGRPTPSSRGPKPWRSRTIGSSPSAHATPSRRWPATRPSESTPATASSCPG